MFDWIETIGEFFEYIIKWFWCFLRGCMLELGARLWWLVHEAFALISVLVYEFWLVLLGQIDFLFAGFMDSTGFQNIIDGWYIDYPFVFDFLYKIQFSESMLLLVQVWAGAFCISFIVKKVPFL